MKAFIFAILLVILVSFWPDVSLAQDTLVAEPCVPGEGACPKSEREAARYGTCEFVETIQNIFLFIIRMMAILVVLTFVIYGLQMVVSAGSTAIRDTVKKYFVNLVVGLILIVSAYAIINTIIMALVGDEETRSGWARIQCHYPTLAESTDLFSGRPTAVEGATSGTLPVAQIEAGLVGVENYRDAVCAQAEFEGIGSECNKILALMSVESGGNPDAVSPVGAAGLLQIMPNTARDLDSRLEENNLSDEAIRERLKDPGYNIALAVKFYAELKREFIEDRLVWAGYNAGAGANKPSSDCDGLRRWECPFDNPQHTKPNIGYRETRNYVPNVQKAFERLELEQVTP